MPCNHSLVPVGMMGVQTRGYEDRPYDDLYYDLERIYKGDINYNSEACNAIHTYQEYLYYYKPGDTKAITARRQYVDLVQKAYSASGGRLKCLVADFTQKKAFLGNESINYFYDGSSGNIVRNLVTVGDFVDGFIDEINRLDRVNNVLGWYLADEPHEIEGKPDKPSLQDFTDICQRAHTVQTYKGWNKPFYVTFYMNDNWSVGGNSINFCQWVEPWVTAVTGTVGPNMVIMIDYYPWLQDTGGFLFEQYPAAEASRSPLRKWWKFIHDTNVQYSNNPKVIGVQAVVQARGSASETYRIPSHADMHQQLRAVCNFMAESGSKPGGVWLYGWGRGASLYPPTPENDAHACKRWTQTGTERWAEAVQNEIDNQVEGIAEAIPDSNTVVRAFPNGFLPYNRTTNPSGGSWVTFKVKDRGNVKFTIKDLSGAEKRQLHWEYNYNSVQQNAANTVSPSPGQVDKLGSTAIFFDGRHNCGYDLRGEYTCRMLMNGNPVGSTLYLYVDWWIVKLGGVWNFMSFPVNKCYYQDTPPGNQPACVELVNIATLGYTTMSGWFSSIISPPDSWETVMCEYGVMIRTLPPIFHTLKYMSPCSGYWVERKRDGLVTLSSYGKLFDINCAIPIPKGWEQVGYPVLTMGYYDKEPLPDISVPDGTEWVKVNPPVADYVFASIRGKYDQINGQYGSYDPDLPPIFSSLHYIAPGTGYDIKMNQSAELIYAQAGYGTEALGLPADEDQVVKKYSAPRPVALLYGSVTYAGKEADVGSQVQVFSQSGVLCGQIEVIHKGYYGLMLVYGDHSATSQANGAKLGEKLIIYVNGKLARTDKEVFWVGDKTTQNVDISA